MSEREPRASAGTLLVCRNEAPSLTGLDSFMRYARRSVAGLTQEQVIRINRGETSTQEPKPTVTIPRGSRALDHYMARQRNGSLGK